MIHLRVCLLKTKTGNVRPASTPNINLEISSREGQVGAQQGGQEVGGQDSESDDDMVADQLLHGVCSKS